MIVILYGALALTVIGLVIALLLARTSQRLVSDEGSLVDAVNVLLPQTQCAQCGYPGCRPYAEAVAAGEAINKCPPGGEATIRDLAELLGRSPLPLAEEPSAANVVAVIREAECIGCSLCLQACPVDAIVGAQRMMHTVIADECTGCQLCIAPCPVDCIDLVAVKHEEHPASALPDATFNCIRCGQCETACPRDLYPQELLWFRESHARLAALNIDRCIECQLCDRVCPSEIPLTAVFRAAKQEMAVEAAARHKARHAEARYHRRVARLAAEATKVRQRPSAEETLSLITGIKQQNG